MPAEVAATGAIERCCERAYTVLSDAVAAANARRCSAFDPLRGLYVAEQEVRETLERLSRPQILSRNVSWRLEELSAITEDGALHDMVACAVAAATVPRLDRVFGFLHEDLTRRTLSAGLAIELAGIGVLDIEVDALLVRLAVIEIVPGDVPLSQAIRIERGFLATLAGETRLDAAIRPHVVLNQPCEGADAGPLFASPLILWGGDSAALRDAGDRRLSVLARPYLRVAADVSLKHIGTAAREALIRGANLAVASSDPMHARDVARFLDGLPLQSIVEAAGGILEHVGASERVCPRRSLAPAASGGCPLPYGRRIAPGRSFDDLVLPEQHVHAIRAIAERLNHRDLVFDKWGLSTGSAIGGVRALFAGPPGTGKTLAAETLSHALGRDLYVVDVSTIVSKYIGETEKALARVFAEAARAGVILFFDEADALFGKRTETKDAHDRYANIETAFLLQALDRYPDLAILATNLIGNLDDALLRRVDIRVDFPMPSRSAREELWKRAVARAPLERVDIAELAERLPLSGGGIQNAALTAAFEAAASGRSIAAIDLVRAARDELAKMGRIAGRFELGRHFESLRAERFA